VIYVEPVTAEMRLIACGMGTNVFFYALVAHFASLFFLNPILLEMRYS
jgi:hypothetical protein